MTSETFSNISGSQSTIISEAPTENSRNNNQKKSHVKCLKFAVLMLLLVGVSLIIAVIVLATDMTSSNDTAQVDDLNQPETCQTPECAITAARVLSGMDQSVDPCEDFYEYACGNWKRTNIISEDRSSRTIFGNVHDKVQIVKKYLIEDEDSYLNFPAVNKAKDLYKSCMNTELIEELDDSVLIPLLEEFGGWPVLGLNPGGNWNESTFDLVESLIKMNVYGYSPLVFMYIYSDIKNSDELIIYLDRPSIGLPSTNYYLSPELNHTRQAYLSLITEIAVAMGAERNNATEDMMAVLELETQIANISALTGNIHDINERYNKTTVGRLKEQYPEPNNTDPIQFSWSEFVLGVFSSAKVTNVTIDESEPIYATTPYMDHVLAILQQHDKRTISNHLILHAVFRSITSLSTRYLDLYRTYIQVLDGSQSLSARWKTCLSTATSYFPMAISHVFVRETFQSGSKTEAEELIDELQEAFDSMLDDVPWMDDATRLKAKEKAHAMREFIGHPDEVTDQTHVDNLYKNYTIDQAEYYWNLRRYMKVYTTDTLATLRKPVNKDEWIIHDMSMVNAFYSGTGNAIIFPAGILQPPFFASGQPKSMNFGGIGMVIGHEITHGFDNNGRQYDKDGNLAIWWEEVIIERFKNQTQCMIDQYNKFVVPEANISMNGARTLGENIADNGGIKESFMAYRKWVERQGREEDSLPGLSLNNNQLFFINFAQIWCQNLREESAIYAVNSGVHSPGRFRTIGSLQNYPEFARVFGCSNNTYMNPPNKCSVW